MSEQATKTAIYARYSSHAQDGGTSIATQRDQCRKAAGNVPTVEYLDEAKTGRALLNRDGLMRLMADAKAGRLGKVIVARFDRLGRSLAETAEVVSQLQDCGVPVISASEGGDPLVRNVLLSVAQHYSEVLSERTRHGLMKRFEQGMHLGPAPYGYKAERNEQGKRRFVVDEAEAGVVRKIFAMYLGGMGTKAIAVKLGEAGIPTKKKQHWAFRTVHAIIINPIYVGVLRFGASRFAIDRKTGKRHGKKCPAGEVMEQRDASLRVIDDATWQKAQERRAKRANPTNLPRSSFTMRPFSGLLFCGTCGKRAYSYRSGRPGKHTHAYLCSIRERGGKDLCPNDTRVREADLAETIHRTFRGLLDDAAGIIAEATAEAEKMMSENKAEVISTRKAMGKLDGRIAKFSALLADTEVGGEARRAILRQVGDMEKERMALEQTVSSLGEKSADDGARLARGVQRAFAEVREGLNGRSPLALHEFVDKFVGPMTIGPNRKLRQLPAPKPSEYGSRSTL